MRNDLAFPLPETDESSYTPGLSKGEYVAIRLFCNAIDGAVGQSEASLRKAAFESFSLAALFWRVGEEMTAED